MLHLLFFVLPLGLDTLGVSISLGMKSHRLSTSNIHTSGVQQPSWLASAILFSLAETLMPLIGLLIGYAASLIIINILHFIGPFLLIAVGLWELVEEIRERLDKHKVYQAAPVKSTVSPLAPLDKSPAWGQQLLLALSVSLDELAVGFSLGTVTIGRGISPLILCILIGLQGFIMTLLGLVLGRTLRSRLRVLKDWSELLSGVLLIGLGIWLLIT